MWYHDHNESSEDARNCKFQDVGARIVIAKCLRFQLYRNSWHYQPNLGSWPRVDNHSPVQWRDCCARSVSAARASRDWVWYNNAFPDGSLQKMPSLVMIYHENLSIDLVP